MTLVKDRRCSPLTVLYYHLICMKPRCYLLSFLKTSCVRKSHCLPVPHRELLSPNGKMLGRITSVTKQSVVVHLRSALGSSSPIDILRTVAYDGVFGQGPELHLVASSLRKEKSLKPNQHPRLYKMEHTPQDSRLRKSNLAPPRETP